MEFEPMKYSWTQIGWTSSTMHELLIALDMLESKVYNNDYTLATEMLNGIGIRT